VCAKLRRGLSYGHVLRNRESPLVHVVLFTLPSTAAPEDRASLLSDIESKLRPLPTVKGLWAGGPADTKTPDRPVVDQDYDVGLLVLFENKAALESYLDHPEHEAFASKWDTYCTVRVFDFNAKAGHELAPA